MKKLRPSKSLVIMKNNFEIFRRILRKENSRGKEARNNSPTLKLKMQFYNYA